MYIENELKKIINVSNLDEYRDGCINTLGSVLEQFISDKKLFNIDDFSALYYDEYTLRTNCHNDIFSVVYLEINQPNNYKPTNTKNKSNKLRFPELFFDLNKIREELYQLFVKNLDNNYLIWHDENAVYIKCTALIDESTTKYFYFKIIPGLTYYNQNNVRGFIYKAGGGIEIEYPELSITNFNKKNKKTKDVYRNTVNIFKNILLQQKDITRLPKEIIEIILYNAPNELFINTSKSNMISIINYLRNCNVKSYKTIDEEDFAFVSQYRSMSPIYVKHILKIIEKYLITN